MAELNCFKNRTSFSINKRRSFTWYLSRVILSIPIPKAKPEYFLGSSLQFSSTAGSTIPQPPISTQPLYLQIGHPFCPQTKHDISTSALGSVKGKNEGRNRISVFRPNISCAK